MSVWTSWFLGKVYTITALASPVVVTWYVCRRPPNRPMIFAADCEGEGGVEREGELGRMRGSDGLARAREMSSHHSNADDPLGDAKVGSAASVLGGASARTFSLSMSLSIIALTPASEKVRVVMNVGSLTSNATSASVC